MTRNIIAILRGIQPSEVEAIGAGLVKAGISIIEVPLNSPDPFESIGRLAARFGETALIGAGTVLTADDVKEVEKAGGRLIVTPDCNLEVIAATKEKGMQSWPGVMTPTECFAALRAGADGLKLFPASLIGTAGLSAMRAVLPPRATVYAVGGVGPDDFAAWRDVGIDGFGLGSSLYRPGDSAATVAERAGTIVAQYDAVFGKP